MRICRIVESATNCGSASRPTNNASQIGIHYTCSRRYWENQINNNNLNLKFSISACNREKRENETNGVDYYFLSTEEFQNKIDNNEFVEWEEVYQDQYYGTLKSEITRIWEEGHNVIFDVDVEGGLSLSKYFGENALTIFIQAPSIEELEKRLRSRGSETEEKIQKRLKKATQEMSYSKWFDVILSLIHI